MQIDTALAFLFGETGFSPCGFPACVFTRVITGVANGVFAALGVAAQIGLTANVINPGPTDTGWMSDELKSELAGRIGTPEDAANLVAFLCSPQGGWINGQLLFSNGGAG